MEELTEEKIQEALEWLKTKPQEIDWKALAEQIFYDLPH